MKILVVDDEIKLVKLVRQVLEDEQYQVETAYTGKAGLEKALYGTFDLLILDWMLPETSGVEVCQAVRRAKNKVPVLLLTARDAIQDRVQGLDAGADDYLVKPFAFEELLARVRALLRRQTATEDLSQNILQVADLSLNLTTREVYRGDTALNLTLKEFALLEFLMRHSGQALSRDQIISNVWQYDFDGNDSVVDMYIFYLRNKVDAKVTPKLIKTLRGVGYSLRAD